MARAKLSKKSASKTEDGLNQRQEEFCQAYIGKDTELFGNGVQCYLQVYGSEYLLLYKKNMTYQVAMVNASRLLSNAKIIKRINELLETGGFNDENIDKQHLFLINQHADFRSKLGAIKEYNALKKRIESKVELHLPKPLLDVLHNNSSKEDSVSEEED